MAELRASKRSGLRLGPGEIDFGIEGETLAMGQIGRKVFVGGFAFP